MCGVQLFPASVLPGLPSFRRAAGFPAAGFPGVVAAGVPRSGAVAGAAAGRRGAAGPPELGRVIS